MLLFINTVPIQINIILYNSYEKSLKNKIEPYKITKIMAQ